MTGLLPLQLYAGISFVAAADGCDETMALVTGCVDEDAVVLTGAEETPGFVPGGPPGLPAPGGAVPSTPRETRPTGCLLRPLAGLDCFADPEAPAIPTVTIRDIATFIPTAGRQQMEPDGWAVAGLHTNFYALIDPHVVEGTLLGRPADVRFTPVAYHWAYGDGTTASLATKGGTWAGLGIPEFEATPTSHVYEQVGDYTITLSIGFTAEYRFDGGPWRPVVGSLTLPANDLHIRVGTAKTVLVDQDCLVNPSGPGC